MTITVLIIIAFVICPILLVPYMYWRFRRLTVKRKFSKVTFYFLIGINLLMLIDGIDRLWRSCLTDAWSILIIISASIWLTIFIIILRKAKKFKVDAASEKLME